MENIVTELRKPERMIRTTLGEFLAKPTFEGAGIYVLACYPTLCCLYIGISNNVLKRLMEHTKSETQLGYFLRDLMADACGFRLDILVAPENSHEWCIEAEKRLIQHFRPTFNQQHLGEQGC